MPPPSEIPAGLAVLAVLIVRASQSRQHEEGVLSWLDEVSLVDGVFDGAFGGVRDEEVVNEVKENVIDEGIEKKIIARPRWDSGKLHRNSGGHSRRTQLASPEQTATGKDMSNPLYGCDGLPKTVRVFQFTLDSCSEKLDWFLLHQDWRLLFFDVATSFDSVVHRVHAVSFDTAVLDVAAPVSAACIIAAGYIVSAGICDAAAREQTKEVGKDAKGNTIVTSSLSLHDGSCSCTKGEKGRTMLIQTGSTRKIDKPDFQHNEEARDIWNCIKARFQKILSQLKSSAKGKDRQNDINQEELVIVMVESSVAATPLILLSIGRLPALAQAYVSDHKKNKTVEDGEDSVPCKFKAAFVPAGSRNSSASVTAGGSDPAASRNRPAVNSAGRPNPTGRVGQAAHLAAAQSNPAGWSKRPAPVSAGRPGDPRTIMKYIGIELTVVAQRSNEHGNQEKLDDIYELQEAIVKFGSGRW
ncbi:hypothetical protein Tco_0802047 [Tanacetum coccineum]|uniref:Uncharacterized protein n=1 Tax=Tanacetum coccineum TaxID=301880 RepID=A0ABQ4ZXR3_9ASTR